MLIDLLYKWPAPVVVEKNSLLQHTNKHVCAQCPCCPVYVPTTIRHALWWHSCTPHIFKNVWYAQHSFLSSNIWRLFQYSEKKKCLKKSQVAQIKYWLYVLFSWFNKPVVMQQCFSLCLYWTYLPPKGFLPLACLKEKGSNSKAPAKVNTGQTPKNDILCSHQVFLKVTLYGVYGFTHFWCVFTEYAECLHITCPFPSLCTANNWSSPFS